MILQIILLLINATIVLYFSCRTKKNYYDKCWIGLFSSNFTYNMLFFGYIVIPIYLFIIIIIFFLIKDLNNEGREYVSTAWNSILEIIMLFWLVGFSFYFTKTILSFILPNLLTILIATIVSFVVFYHTILAEVRHYDGIKKKDENKKK